MSGNDTSPPSTVSRETLTQKCVRIFSDNLAMMEQARHHCLLQEKTGQNSVQKHNLASGPRPPQWAIDNAEQERAALAASEQATRRRMDGVEKITVEQLLALDITRYAKTDA